MRWAGLFDRSRRAALAAALVASFVLPPAFAKPVPASEIRDRTEVLPKRLEGIDVEEQLDTAIPKGLRFRNHEGREVRLGDYVDGKVPVILTLNYSSCPMLCSLQLNGLVDSLAQVDWTLGKDYRVVTIILDPKETPERAKQTHDRYIVEYGRPEAAQGWQFLTGNEGQVKAAAAAIGFSYGYNEARQEYIHPAAIAMLTPDGKIARYLYGIEYHPKTVRLSLVDVAEGKIGSPFDKLILYCFHYDETEGKYAPVAMNIMRVGGGLAALVLGGFLTSFWVAEARRKKVHPTQGSDRNSET
jgi:protein SCO1/2